jgi:purine-binding chemotaxis protein CheW
MMNSLQLKDDMEIVVFSLDEPRYALDLSAVERVVHAVEITPLPKAPEIVLGVINVQGEVVPVVDVRNRFRLPEREINIDDRFIIARTSRRLVALLVDDVTGVQRIGNREIVSAEQALPFAEYIKGVAKVEGDIVLIHDLDRFLSLDEEEKLDEAQSGGAI